MTDKIRTRKLELWELTQVQVFDSNELTDKLDKLTLLEKKEKGKQFNAIINNYDEITGKLAQITLLELKQKGELFDAIINEYNEVYVQFTEGGDYDKLSSHSLFYMTPEIYNHMTEQLTLLTLEKRTEFKEQDFLFNYHIGDKEINKRMTAEEAKQLGVITDYYFAEDIYEDKLIFELYVSYPNESDCLDELLADEEYDLTDYK